MRRITATIMLAIETDVPVDTLPLYELREGLEDEIARIREVDNGVDVTRVHVTRISEQETSRA